MQHGYYGSEILDDPIYLNALLKDYEMAVCKIGPITLSDFLACWNCIPKHKIRTLSYGDEVYVFKNFVLNKHSSIVKNVYLDNGIICVDTRDIDGYLETYVAGELYFDNKLFNVKIMENYIIKGKKEKEKKICPILITGTNPPQN